MSQLASNGWLRRSRAWLGAAGHLVAGVLSACIPLTRAPLAEFAAALGAALHPGHGCFLLNLHSLEGPHPVATFKNGLLGGAWSADSDSNGPSASSGTCFAVAAQRQRNVCVVVARGLALPADQAAAGRLLLSEAQRVAEAAGYRFPAGSRACRQLQLP